MKLDCAPCWEGQECHEQCSDHRSRITNFNQGMRIVCSHSSSY